jgi:Tfp pilus assembly protein PilN
LRPFSQKYWQERRILYAAEQQRKRRFWTLIGLLLAVLFVGLVVGVSITAFPDDDMDSTIMTGH